MKNILFLSLLVLVVFSCKSPSKLVEQGDYDKAIERSVKKMLKENAKNDDKEMLDKAYKLANQRDEERIKLLKTEGKPENWEQIYFAYSRLDSRQRQVRKVLPFEIKGKQYNYTQVDYTSSIVEAKTKAAEYYYAHGNRLMSEGKKVSYRRAYSDFVKAKQYRGSAYPDINGLLSEAKMLGTSHVLVEVANHSRIQFGADFYDELLSVRPSSVESSWVEYYYGRTDRSQKFDYTITVELKRVIFSPETYNSKEILREKKVQDGFQYVLDDRGNVKKDSLGNDIKLPKYKYIRCRLIEKEQLKEVTVEANVKYFDGISRKVLMNESIAATSIFSHVSGQARGDTQALTREDLELLKSDPLPFPDDISMLYDCLPPLKQSLKEVLQHNKGLIY